MFFRTGINRSAMDDHLEFCWDVIELFALFPPNLLHHLAIDWADDVRFGQGVFDDFLGQSVGDQSATMFLWCALRGLLFLLPDFLKQLLQVPDLEEQHLVGIDPFAFLSAKRAQKFQQPPLLLLHLLPLIFDRSAEGFDLLEIAFGFTALRREVGILNDEKGT